jgi:hypothetical protein
MAKPAKPTNSTKATTASLFAKCDPVTKQLVIDKLESSGLTPQDAEDLGMEGLNMEHMKALSNGFSPVPSLKIPYWHPRRQSEPLAAHPMWNQFYRVRYLMSPRTDDGKKPQKYSQEAGIGVCAYFPRLLGVKWAEILDDPRIPLIITEGELKAAKACKERFPTIGLGGVSSYKSRAMGHIELLPELQDVKWVRRTVYIIFDSDIADNPNVVAALNDLAQALHRQGAFPKILLLPQISDDADQKTGLDDFLVARPSEKLQELMDKESEPLTAAKGLFALNEKVAYVDSLGSVMDIDSLSIMSTNTFNESKYSTALYEVKVMGKGTTVSQKVSLTRSWLGWPLRHSRAQLTYHPGAPKLIDADGEDPSMINTWPGWGKAGWKTPGSKHEQDLRTNYEDGKIVIDYKKHTVKIGDRVGDVKLFLELLDHVFEGAELEAKAWFLKWCAYPLRFPGVKLFTAAILYGIHHGTGKSLIGYTLGKMYGKNFSEIKQADLHAGFNAWAEKKQFVLADDITGSSKREDADVLKKMITQKTLRVNAKYMPEYEIPDCINYLFTSNSIDALFLEDSDRRYFVHEVQAKPKDKEEGFYQDYDIWLNHSGGAEYLFHYLRNLPGLDAFEPGEPAMRTKAKDRMTADSLSDLGTWVRELRDEPDMKLNIGLVKLDGDLFTNKELLAIFGGDVGRGGSSTMGRELKRAGIRQVCEGVPIKVNELKLNDRFYAIRNTEKWRTASLKEAQAHILKTKKHRNMS